MAYLWRIQIENVVAKSFSVTLLPKPVPETFVSHPFVLRLFHETSSPSYKYVSEIRWKQIRSDNCNLTMYLTHAHVNRASVTVEVNMVHTCRLWLVTRLIQTVLSWINAIDGCCHSKSLAKKKVIIV